MHVLVIGAGGMLGQKLVKTFALTGKLRGQRISRITRHDAVLAPPPPVSAFDIQTQIGDISHSEVATKLIAERPDVIFHLAAIVSGEAEDNFEKGYNVNLYGTRHVLEAIRLIGGSYCPRFLFTSSIAVFGAPFPESIEDTYFTTPLTSYGTQKAICELLISDYARRGFIQGLSLRMPTVCVRPGKPNKAASGFFSNIIREPLVGHEAILPVSDQVRHWHASPRAAVAMLIHGAEIDLTQVGPRRALNMPGVSCTVAQQIAALGRIAGDKAVRLIKSVPDEAISRIVAGWPSRFDAKRALALGFKADEDFDAIIRAHVEDELQGKL
ncbi:MAG: SDR family oxidoreductase [Alphaproteobacteria bacterium]|nr:SDR family oxidoreductase [Alphaproteobacteria bacterium]